MLVLILVKEVKDGIILAIREYLSFTTSVYLDKTNSFKFKVYASKINREYY